VSPEPRSAREVLPGAGAGLACSATMRRICALLFAALVVGACSGGGSSSSSATATATGAARQQGAVVAARACRMWSEVAGAALHAEPLSPGQAAPYDAKSAAIAAVANTASNDDPAWNALATDVAGANDFASAALPDINNRIVTDCLRLPAGVVKTVSAEPDPFSTTSTTAP
jgi:hypothetical protein